MDDEHHLMEEKDNEENNELKEPVTFKSLVSHLEFVCMMNVSMQI